MSDALRFPVLGGGMTVPWSLLAPHEPQAQANHDQSLKRLAERGGLSWTEMLCVLEARGWRHGRELTDEAAKPLVLALVEAHEAREVVQLRAQLQAASALAAAAGPCCDPHWVTDMGAKRGRLAEALAAFERVKAGWE
jgi:hypothetical protein